MKLSVLIKAFNEEENIGRCLSAVYRALAEVDAQCEVIVADGLSTDATAETAMRQGARVVQLRDAADRGCGAGVQLGFQHSNGEYVLLLDGDMELDPSFLPEALACLEEHADVAGVGGVIRDTFVRNWFDRRRAAMTADIVQSEVRWLAGGGLYRAEAIQEAGGYAGNRNLQAFEEAELGLRLGASGWRLIRLPITATRHSGHATSTLRLVWHHWKIHRLDAGGVLLRISVGKPWFKRVMYLMIHPILVSVWWALLLLAMAVHAPIALTVLALVAALGYILMATKKGSLLDAAISVWIWHITAIATAKGFLFRPLRSPADRIDSRELADEWRGGA